MKKHGHWVNNLSLNTDYACRTGSCDHTGVVITDPIQSQKRALERYNAVKGEACEILASGLISFFLLSQSFLSCFISSLFPFFREINILIKYSPFSLLILQY